jgi:hypothetical protein
MVIAVLGAIKRGSFILTTLILEATAAKQNFVIYSLYVNTVGNLKGLKSQMKLMYMILCILGPILLMATRVYFGEWVSS